MANEVLQWTVLLVLGVVVLGVLRQVSLYVPAKASGSISGPKIGAPLPKRFLAQLGSSFSRPLPDEYLVAFVKEGCVACSQLLTSLENSWTNSEGLPVVLVAKTTNPEFESALVQLGFPLLVDRSGSLWRSLNVSATPLVIKVRSGAVLAREVTHLVDKVATAA